MPTDFVALFAVLDAARIRYVVVGGLALLLHGIDRLTADVDLVVDLSTDAVREAVRALTEAGYRPLAPVEHLIRTKRASGRPKDLADIERLDTLGPTQG